MLNIAINRFQLHTDRSAQGGAWFNNLLPEQKADQVWLLANAPEVFLPAVAAAGLALTPSESLQIARHLFRGVPLGNGTVFTLLADLRLQAAVTTGERLLGGTATPADLNAARIAAIAACNDLAAAGPAGPDPSSTGDFIARVDAAVATCAPSLGTNSTAVLEIQYVLPAMAEACASAVAGIAWATATGSRDSAWAQAKSGARASIATEIRALIRAR
jgi:hypothetical protein